jgi:predicted DNA-binding transcriptional regulator AlpA
MPKVSAEQRAPYPSASLIPTSSNELSPAAAGPRSLPRYLRFRDLVAAGLISNWPTLLRWIEDEGFPPGRYLAPNTRAWTTTEIEAWLASRPLAQKPRDAGAA